MKRQAWSPDVVALGDRIAALSAKSATELSDYLETVHGLSPAEAALFPDVEADVIVEPARPEPTEFDVVVEGYDLNQKIALIRTLRELTGLGLKESVALVGAFPQSVKEKLALAEAEAIRGKLEAAGAKVSLRPAAA
jgi:large subunit ribosomal protein L7/L12